MTSDGASGTPAVTDSPPPAGEPTANVTPPAGDTGGGDNGPVDVAVLQRELATARKDAARYREDLRTREAADQAAKDAAKSELTRATERAAALELELAAERTGRQSDKVRLASFGAASKLGFRNPTIAHQLIDMASVTFNDAGEPTNIDALLTEVAKANDYLVGPKPDFGGGPRGAPTGPATDMNDAIRRAAGRA